jgi:DNA polymerase I-like protein with 3'-5' exonuclease and polymerase domains
MLTIDNPKTFDWASISLPDCIEGNCWDSYFTLKLFNKFEEILRGDDRWNLYKDLLCPVSDEFLEMEFDGNCVDLDAVTRIGRAIRNNNIRKEDSMYESDKVNTKYSLTSNDDIGKILFLDDKGFGLFPPQFTDNEAPKVAKDALEQLLEQIEFELLTRPDV